MIHARIQEFPSGGFILHVRDHENSEEGGWMGVYILYQKNALFLQNFFKRLWSG